MNVSRPNILWVVLDSVRVDHTSIHGYHRETTPEISRIASSKEGVNFEHGIAHSTRTPVSVTSILTGLYPSRHRMIGSQAGDKLPDSMITVPELFSEVGYQTIGVSENVYAGVAKGIDERFDDFTKSAPSNLRDFLTIQFAPTLLKYGLNTRSHGPGLTLNRVAHGEQNSFFTTDITKRKLHRNSKSEKPFFCYVHYNDPHHPYIPPQSHREEFIDEIDSSVDEAISFAKRMHDELYEWVANDLPLTDDEWDMLHAMYDATIKYVDACVGELFDFVQNRFEDVVVVISSDHGELFGEYGLLGHHIVLHDGLIHVPLVTHGLSNVKPHCSQPTQHIDVMKTLLSLVGANTSQFQGYDIRSQSREIAISQDLRGSVDDNNTRNYNRIRQINPDIDLSHLPKSMITSARTTEFKLVHTEQRSNLYNLPNEIDDVSNEYPAIFEDLTSYLGEWLESKGAPFDVAPKQTDLTEETKQHLQDMGYMQ